MQSISGQPTLPSRLWLTLCLVILSTAALALETDRQQPLEVNANATNGTLGDGVTTLQGDVEIRQGTLHITADEAEVSKVDGRVQSVTFRGRPAFLQQEIEEQGMVKATARVIEYQVAKGLVTLNGQADVKHPQYEISGELLTYDLNVQHFQGNGNGNGKGNGRIHIRLDPEVIDQAASSKDKEDKDKIEKDKEDKDDKPDDSEAPGNSGEQGG